MLAALGAFRSLRLRPFGCIATTRNGGNTVPTTNRKDEVLNDLIEGIARLTTSERWQEWLDVQSRFHRYSFNNTLLI